jgi:hypothetical protein
MALLMSALPLPAALIIPIADAQPSQEIEI